MSYIIRVKLNNQWVEIPAIKGDKGDPGETTDWRELDDKPFETIGNGLSVSSSGVLSADTPVATWSNVNNKPFETIGNGFVVDSSGELTADIPTEVSDFNNDAGYITAGIFSYDSTTNTLSITTV